MRTLGRGDRQVERDQLAAVGGLDLELVVPLPVAVLDARGRQAAQPRGLGPGAAVVVPHDRAAPVHLLGWRGRAEELGTQGRILIRHQVQPTAGRHLVAQARLGQGAFGHAPQRGGETREQPERRQHQRQADQHQSTHQRHAGHHVRSRGHAARLHVGQPVQRDQRTADAQGPQHHGQGALVEQERRERREQGEAQQAAVVAQAAGLTGLDRQHRGQQRAAGIATEAEPRYRQHGRQHRQRQQDAHECRKRPPPRCGGQYQSGRAEAEGERGRQLHQQRQQAQRRTGQRPQAAVAIGDEGDVSVRHRHAASARGRAGRGGDGRGHGRARGPAGRAG